MMDPDDTTAEELAAMAEALGDDRATDIEDGTRQERGWIKFYLECPACAVAMVTTSSESAAPADADVETMVEFRALCPKCKEIQSVVSLTRRNRPFGE